MPGAKRPASVRLTLKGAKQVEKDLKKLGKDGNKSLRLIQHASKQAARGMNDTGVQAVRLKSTMKQLTTAVSAYAAIRLAKTFLDASNTAEQYNLRLKILLGDQEEANRLFGELTKFAARVPFEFEKIMEAATSLGTVVEGGAHEILKFMPLVANLAASSGLTIEKTAEQFSRAYISGANNADTFRERGVNAMLGIAAGTKISARETREIFERELSNINSKFAGATEELATSWDGILSIMSDKWFIYRRDLTDSAPFDFLKSSFDSINKKWDENSEEMSRTAEDLGHGIVEVFQDTALRAARIFDAASPAFDVVGGALESAADGYNNLPTVVQDIGIVGALFFGAKGFAVLAAASAASDLVADLMLSFSDVSPFSQARDELEAELRRNNPNLSQFEIDTILISPESMQKIFERSEEIKQEIQDMRNVSIEAREQLERTAIDMLPDGKEVESLENTLKKFFLEVEKNTQARNEQSEKRNAAIKQAKDEAAAEKAATEALKTKDKKLREVSKSYGELVDKLENEIKALALSGKQREEFVAKLKSEEAARKLIKKIASDTKESEEEVLEIYGEQIEKVKELTRQKKVSQEAQKDLEASIQPFLEAADDTREAFASTFENIFNDGINIFDDLGEEIENIIKRTAANIAAALIFKPIIAPVFSGVAESFLGKAAGEAVASSLGIGGGSGIGIDSVFSLGNASLSGFQSVAAGKFLAGSALELGLSAETAAILGNAGLNLPFGIIGGLGAKALGLGSGNALIDTGLGTLGALGGSALGSSLAALGAFGGPLGAIAGAFLGTALGTVFKKRPSDKTQTGLVDLSSGEILKRTGLGGTDPNNPGKKFSQENYDAVNNFSELAVAIAQLVSGPGGIKEQLDIIVGNRDGLRLRFRDEEGNPIEQNFGGSVDAFIKGLVNGIVERSPDVSESILTAIENIDFSDTEQALKDLEFAAGFDKLGEAPEKINELEEQIKSLNTLFEEAARTAERLGLSVEKVTDAQEDALKQVAKDFDSRTSNMILEMTDPLQAQANAINAFYDQLVEDAVFTGGNIEQVERARQLALDQLFNSTVDVTGALKGASREALKIRDTFQKVSDKITQTIQGFNFSTTSVLNPQQQLDEAKAQFLKFAAQAELGDEQAALQAIEFAKIFRDTSRQINASNEDFKADDTLIKQKFLAIQDVANRHVERQNTIAEKQLSALERIEEAIRESANGISGASDKNPLLRPGQTLGNLNSAFNTLNQLPEQVVRQIKHSFGFDFSDLANVGTSFKDFVRAYSDPQTLAAAVNAAFVAAGGKAQTFSLGGLVTGGVRGRDSVPAYLTPGEFVIPEPAVKRIGLHNLEALRAGSNIAANNNTTTNGFPDGNNSVGNNAEMMAVLREGFSTLIRQNNHIIDDNAKIKREQARLLARRTS